MFINKTSLLPVLNNKEASRILLSGMRQKNRKKFFSSDGQLPVPSTLNAHLSTLNSAIIYLILILSIVLQSLIELFIESLDLHIVFGFVFNK